MNVFVLCTGRCGSTTFIKACRHASNFTAGHETRAHLVSRDRLAYPDNHIEADNRLSWYLGRLDKAYGDKALYVHLRRDPGAVARSFLNRWDSGIMKAYRRGILFSRPGSPVSAPPLEIARDYCETVDANIELFLQNRPHVMGVWLENVESDFARFWDWAGLQGDRSAALGEWKISHNASSPRKNG